MRNILKGSDTQLGEWQTKALRDGFTEEVLEKQPSVIWQRRQTYEPIFLVKWIHQHKNIKLFEGMCASSVPGAGFYTLSPSFSKLQCLSSPQDQIDLLIEMSFSERQHSDSHIAKALHVCVPP